MQKRVAVIKGDGVGPELIEATLKVLRVLDLKNIELILCDAGYEWWEEHGGDSFIPDKTWEVLKSSSACLKAPTTTVPKAGLPKSVAVSIRQAFDLYANVRPIKTFPNREGPLGKVDFVCVREATEGLYSGLDFRISEDTAISIRKITRKGSERIIRFAYNLAKEKNWKKVIVIHKGNILRESDGLFLEAARKVAEEYKDIEMEEYMVDNMAQQLVKNPQRFNQCVLVSTNLFMDILSEEAAALIGSIGCVYSANFGDNYAMFEPAHGSAPKYKNLNKVNPTATILSAAWMLDYLNEKKYSKLIFDSTYEVIAEGKYLTYDLGGNSTTWEMAEAIAEKLKKKLSESFY
ncbi:Isocitrate dehydrogenase [NADP] [archaeon HR06]|nr:Isocitrate dehydrogenase [NADP] [archaeon HR06]